MEPMSSRRCGDLVYGAHLALVATLLVGRMLRALGSDFAASAAGRGLALVAMLVGVGSLGVVVVGTVRERRDARLVLLAVLFLAALAWRRGPDALDAVYAVVAAALAVHWFARGRGAGAAAGTPGTPSG
jgi:hypothetical protein